MSDSLWTEKGATLSDKSAAKEFGLTQEEIIQAIREEKLQYRPNYIHGNPYLRLLRKEVEALVKEKYGAKYLEQKNLNAELAKINKEIRSLKTKLQPLEKRKAELLESSLQSSLGRQ